MWDGVEGYVSGRFLFIIGGGVRRVLLSLVRRNMRFLYLEVYYEVMLDEDVMWWVEVYR